VCVCVCGKREYGGKVLSYFLTQGTHQPERKHRRGICSCVASIALDRCIRAYMSVIMSCKLSCGHVRYRQQSVIDGVGLITWTALPHGLG